VESILAQSGDDFELIVIDQSENAATREALAPLQSDSRLRYLRTSTRGVSRARNLGIESSRASLIAFTDDDCRVQVDWLSRIVEGFTGDPDAALIFGRVTVPPDVDGRNRWAASFEPTKREHQHALPAPDEAWGIGANMAARRSTFDTIGSFDPLLGPGALFSGAEEYDLTIRAIAAGLKVLTIREASVLHLGVREGAVAVALVRRYAMGIGAALSKHVRLGTRDSARLLTRCVTTSARTAAVNTLLGRRPTNVAFVGSLLYGMLRSCTQPIDRSGGIFLVTRSSPAVRGV
jgi:glycosyltransferase involved in cell wall biosynthesis